MDGWFLSLSGNPEKLDKYIRRYEHARILNFIVLVIILSLLLVVVILSEKGINDNGFTFIFVICVFILVLNMQSDIYTKILKLQRQQQKRDTEDAKPPSGVSKKSSISVIALVYGPVLGVLILGFLMFVYIS